MFSHWSKLIAKPFFLCAVLASQIPLVQAQESNAVVDWNRNLLLLVRTPGVQPPTMHSTRSFAMMHLAMDRAIRALNIQTEGTAAMQSAAAIAAADRMLVRLYPGAEPTIVAMYNSSLSALPSSGGLTEAIAIGQRVADRIFRERAEDGASSPPIPYAFGSGPGAYESTPPNFPKQPQLTNWGNVRPFALRYADQFEPGAPPSLASALYSKDLAEVQTLGVAASSSASADRMLIGRFWNGAIQNYWNEIAQNACVQMKLDTPATAHVFALLNITLADSVIAFYQAKYKYNFWRPVTAIRVADPNVTPGTLPDPLWLPEVGNTAPDPSYPGAHAVISAAAAQALISTLGTDWIVLDVTSEVMGGVTRHFDSISEAAAEASVSRVYAGVHFRFDLDAGEVLGHRVADYVLEHER